MNKRITTEPIFSKGKSFSFLGCWLPNTEYRNDSTVQHFVSYDGILWGCAEYNINQTPSKTSRYWFPAVKGVKGEKGKEIVEMHEISKLTYVEDDIVHNFIMVVYSDGTAEPFELKIKTAKGDTGPQGLQGEKGEKGDSPVISVSEDGIVYSDGQVVSTMVRDVYNRLDTRITDAEGLLEDANFLTRRAYTDHITAANDHDIAIADHRTIEDRYLFPTGGIPISDLNQDAQNMLNNIWLSEDEWNTLEHKDPNVTYNIYEEE